MRREASSCISRRWAIIISSLKPADCNRERENVVRCTKLFLDISSLSLIQCSQSNCACRMLRSRNFQWNSHNLFWFELIRMEVAGSIEVTLVRHSRATSIRLQRLCLATTFNAAWKTTFSYSLCVMPLLLFFFRHTLDTSTICETCKVSLARCRSECISCCLSHVLNFDANEHGFWSLRLRNNKTE